MDVFFSTAYLSLYSGNKLEVTFDKNMKSYVLASGAAIRPYYTGQSNKIINLGLDTNGPKGPNIVGRDIWQKKAMYRFFQVNRDIFFRTLCLVMVTMFFTSAGAAQGEVVLAVNTLLMQLFTLFSYIMDGFAYAGEALAGRYIGAKNQTGLRSTVRHLFYWGFGLSLVFTILYSVGGKEFLGLLTNDASVINASDSYFYWALAIPLAGFSAFLWDGVFIGATATRQMLYSMLIASASFFGIYYAFHSLLGNHALWLAFLVYLSLRGIVQTFLGRQIMKKVIVSQ